MQAVLTGHVVQRAGAFVVAAELVDVDDGSQLWGTALNRRVADGFALQAEMSEELTNALRLRLSRNQRKRLGKQHTANADAYQLYLRGRYFLNDRTGDALKLARTLFERAVAEDPEYALAHAGLADCCSLIAVSLRASSGSSLIEQARAAAFRALQLDEGLAEAHASLAFIKFRFEWDWIGAEAEFKWALALNPGHAPSRQWLAMFLASRSRFDEALAEMKRALELDPLSLIIQSGIGRILHFAGRLDEAIGEYEHVLQTNPRFAQARIDLALTRMARGELAAARTELGRAREILGGVSTIVLLEACCAAREGRHDDAQAAFRALREGYDSNAAGADDLAMLAAVLGEFDAALRVADRSVCAAGAIPRLCRRRAGDGAAPSGSRLPRAASPARISARTGEPTAIPKANRLVIVDASYRQRLVGTSRFNSSSQFWTTTTLASVGPPSLPVTGSLLLIPDAFGEPDLWRRLAVE